MSNLVTKLINYRRISGDHLSVFVTRVSDMAAAKLGALLLLFALVFTTGVFADAGIDGGGEPKLAGSDGGVDLASEIELEQLNAKIRALG